MKLKQLKFHLAVKKAMKMVLKNPPKGTKIKEYTYKKLTNDIIFCLNVKLSAHDISIITSKKENTFGAYLISEYEKAKKRIEEERKYNEVNAKYFKEFLESKDEYMSDYNIQRTVQGYMPFYARENDLYREYLGTKYSMKAKEELDKK